MDYTWDQVLNEIGRVSNSLDQRAKSLEGAADGLRRHAGRLRTLGKEALVSTLRRAGPTGAFDDGRMSPIRRAFEAARVEMQMGRHDIIEAARPETFPLAVR